mgnify:CR=1 FL=1
MELHLPGKTLTLPRVSAVSGTRYGNNQMTFWMRNPQEARLEADNQSSQPCQRTKTVWEAITQDNGGFMANGQEPGWYIQVTPGERFELVTQYGEQTHRFPPAEPVPSEDTITYATRSGDDDNLPVKQAHPAPPSSNVRMRVRVHARGSSALPSPRPAIA